MQVLLNIPESYFEDECSSAFACFNRAKIEKAYNLSPGDDVEVVNIGLGADWLVFLATITTTSWTLFQLPGILKKSIEGWRWLIEKLKAYKIKKQLVSLDQDAAGMLAIDYVANKYGEESFFDLIDYKTIPVVDISGMVRNKVGGLVDHPFDYYVFTFRVVNESIILGVRSSGEIREMKSIDDIPDDLFDCIY